VEGLNAVSSWQTVLISSFQTYSITFSITLLWAYKCCFLK